MGRKPNSKGKEKRLQRKEEQLRLSAAKAVVDKANKLQDPLEPFPVFRKFCKNNIEVHLSVKRVGDLEPEVVKWILDLTKRNMEAKYNACSWGWSDKKKREEMTEEAAWYLIAKTIDGKLLGFSHFRFDLDYGDEVLYCYELQLESQVHRKGLGKFMMQVLELVAFTNNMRKVVLTTLKNNPPARAFFHALNYRTDDTSPEDDYETEHPYEILSKYNKKLVQETPPAPAKSAHQQPANPLAMYTHCCPGHHHHH